MEMWDECEGFSKRSIWCAGLTWNCREAKKKNTACTDDFYITYWKICILCPEMISDVLDSIYRSLHGWRNGWIVVVRLGTGLFCGFFCLHLCWVICRCLFLQPLCSFGEPGPFIVQATVLEAAGPAPMPRSRQELFLFVKHVLCTEGAAVRCQGVGFFPGWATQGAEWQRGR